MLKTPVAVGIAVLLGQVANAGGLDRTNQPMGVIFQNGNYAELSFGSTTPNITGTDTLTNPIANVAGNFTTLTGAIKFDLNDKLSVALIADQPFGSDINYGGAPTTTMLGGTSAVATSFSLTALGRYKFTDQISAHAGVRYQAIQGDITLSGLSYGPLNGYSVSLAKGEGVGFVVGAAFEIPQYKARVALTYNSEITHNLGTAETINGVPAFGVSPDTEVKSPASINLDVQTGINEKTLLFGSIRYAKWSDFKISPTGFDASVAPGSPGNSISDLEDTFAYSLGVGRQVTDNFSATVAVGFEPKGSDDLVSPLAPTNGNWSVALGGRYKMDNAVLSTGIRYTMFNDARPETGTPDTARARFTGASAVSIGMKMGFSF